MVNVFRLEAMYFDGTRCQNTTQRTNTLAIYASLAPQLHVKFFFFSVLQSFQQFPDYALS